MTDTAPATGGQGAAVLAAPATPATPATPAEWTAGLSDDLRGYVQNKGWKDTGSAIESYRNLEKLRGVPQERLLALPEKADAPEWAGIWSKLGVPESPDGYELPEVYGEEFGKAARSWFHEARIPGPAAKQFLDKFAQHYADQKTAADTKFAQTSEVEMQEVKKEWGAAAPAMQENAKRATAHLGLDGEMLDALERAVGTKRLMGMMAKVGDLMTEHKFIGGGGRTPSFGNTPEAARERIAALKADKAWAKKYVEGDADARSEFDRLHRIAAGS